MCVAYLRAMHLILYQVEDHIQSPENCGQPEQGKKTKTASGAILGKDIMEAIWADMTYKEEGVLS